MGGRRSYLLYFLFLWDLVVEPCGRSEARHLCFILWRRIHSIKSIKCHIHWIICARIGFYGVPFKKHLWEFFVLLCPEFPIVFIFSYFLNLVMWVIVPRSWTYVSQEGNILMKESPFLLHFLSLFLFLYRQLFLFYRLLQAIGTNSWHLSLLLVNFNLLEICVFNEFLVDFAMFCNFLQMTDIPGLICAMND